MGPAGGSRARQDELYVWLQRVGTHRWLISCLLGKHRSPGPAASTGDVHRGAGGRCSLPVGGKFRNGEDEWKAWEFHCKVSARAAGANMAEAMKVAEQATNIVTTSVVLEPEGSKWSELEDKAQEKCARTVASCSFTQRRTFGNTASPR